MSHNSIEIMRTIIPLINLGVLAVRGVDARSFLQGQLSQDVLKLKTGEAVLASLNNPQGRTLAIMWLVLMTDEIILAVLPRSGINDMLTNLKHFIFRAKVQLTDESSLWNIEGSYATSAPKEGLTWANSPAGRFLQITRLSNRRELEPATATEEYHWHCTDIADGLPKINTATRALFVAQMLNLDLIGGISFTKGCYTGQEVIARAHYRGQVKRRMQRLRTFAPELPIHIGDAGTLRDGRTFKVVDAVQLSDGRIDLLAVTTFAEATSLISALPITEDVIECSKRTINCENLPLPYALPL